VLVNYLLTGVHNTPASSCARGVLTTAGDSEIQHDQQQHQQLHTARTAHTAQQKRRDAASSRRTTAVAAVWQAAHTAVQHRHRHSTNTCMQSAVKLRGGSAGSDNGVALEAQRSDCDEDSSSLLSPSQALVTS
jgi:hypothetical protein